MDNEIKWDDSDSNILQDIKEAKGRIKNSTSWTGPIIKYEYEKELNELYRKLDENERKILREYFIRLWLMVGGIQ